MKTILPSLLCFLGLRIQGDLDGITCYRSKRGGIIWYPRAPPLKPPSGLQAAQRDKWKDIIEDWNELPAGTRNAWMDMAVAAHLTIHGFNLYIWWRCHYDDETIRTLERQTGIDVLP